MANTHNTGPIISANGFISGDGITITSGSLVIGATTISEAEVRVLDAVTPGTATASKALVLGASKDIATITSATITTLTSTTVNATNIGAAAITGDLTVATAKRVIHFTSPGTCTSNAVTISQQGGVVTTESLSTAGGASQAIVITNSLVTTSSAILVTRMGGTNTTLNFALTAVPTSNTITVTIANLTAATSLNGTIIFSFMVIN